MKKAPEWKDTKFPFSIDYNYSLFVRNRCKFFYCFAKNIRKMINYAANFTSPNEICVIYVYGEPAKIETVLKQISEQHWNMLIIIIPGILSEHIKSIETQCKWLNKLQKSGYRKTIIEGREKSQYNNRIIGTVYADKPTERWYEDYNCPELPEFYKIYTEGMEIMERAKLAHEVILQSSEGKLMVLANFPLPCKSINGDPLKHDNDLLEIIRHLYPYGVECDTSDPSAVKLLKIKKLVEAAFNREITKDVENLHINIGDSSEQICFWDNITTGASECVQMFRDRLTQEIKETGCFNVSSEWFEFSKPPYGAYECNWYEYIFAYVMRDFFNSNYFWGNYYYSEKITDGKKYNEKYKYGFVFVQNEEQEEFNRLFAKLFDITPREATIVTLNYIRSWVTENISHTPLDWLDHNFHEILAGNDDKAESHVRYWEKKQQYWYKYGYEKKYLPWLKANFDELYSKIRTIDSDFHNWLAEKYGKQKADGFCKHYKVKGGAVGWLHTIEMVERKIDDYMNNDTCAECGRYIGIIGRTDFGYIAYEFDENHKSVEYRFTHKEVVGLNKKLLGRGVSNYLCIPCLSEYTEYSVSELWNMMHEFKEQGCTLF